MTHSPDTPATPEGDAVSRALPNAYYECAGCTQQGSESNCRPAEEIRLAPDETWLCEYCYDDAAYECGEDANWPVWADLPKLIAALPSPQNGESELRDILRFARRLTQGVLDEAVSDVADWEALADRIDAALAPARARILSEMAADDAAALTAQPVAQDCWPSGAHRHWRVIVETGADQIVCLETECLSGRELSDADEATIRQAARHLLSFIGDPAQPVAQEVRTDGPERIWAWAGDEQDGWENAYATVSHVSKEQVEYIRADLAQSAPVGGEVKG